MEEEKKENVRREKRSRKEGKGKHGIALSYIAEEGKKE